MSMLIAVLPGLSPATQSPGLSTSTEIALTAGMPASMPTTQHATVEQHATPPTAAPQTSPTPTPTSTPLPTRVWSPAAGPSQIVERGTSGRREIALTFDGGAERGDAEEILAILRDTGVLASFGITADWARANPDLVRQMVADGHLLFNHGSTHRSWTGYSTASDVADPSTWQPLSRDERIAEVSEAQQVIGEIAGVPVTPYFRPPYADYDEEALILLGELGYPVFLMWSCESLAWMGMTAEEIVARCSTDPQPGDIILLHITDGGVDSEALPGLIETFRGQDFEFVRVDALLLPSDGSQQG